jgi:hypothetical protein
MQYVHRQLAVPQGVKPLAHDTGGRLSGLHVESMAKMFGAQFLKDPEQSNPAYIQLKWQPLG